MANPALIIDGLSVDFGGFKAVDGFSTVIDDGELRVVLGPNGAGKTTMMDLITGNTRSTGGTVTMYGKDITNHAEHEIARAGLGRKFQIPSVFRDLTVFENFEVAVTKQQGVFGNLRFALRASEKEKLDQIIELTQTSDVIDKRAGDLSHGQMQWLELGMLIAQDSRVILLDEPTAGMTQGETYRTSQIIKALKGQHTIIVVEHDMAFVREIAEKITVMHLGKMLAEGRMDVIENDPKVQDAYLGSGGIH
ncbi:MAG: urea ABC transporter ATP-binding protein UrtD [Pseudomonadota bacterium]